MVNLAEEKKPLNLDKLWASKSPSLVHLAFTERYKELFLVSFEPHLFMYKSSIMVLFAKYWVVLFFYDVGMELRSWKLDQYSDLIFYFGRNPRFTLF